jgi:hypothetical protein
LLQDELELRKREEETDYYREEMVPDPAAVKKRESGLVRTKNET